MKQFQLFSFFCFPIVALPLILISANEVFSLLPMISGDGVIFLAFIAIFAVLLFHTTIVLIFGHTLFRWVDVVVKAKNSSLIEYIDSQKKDLVSTMIVLEVLLFVVALVAYVPGVREVFVALGKLL